MPWWAGQMPAGPLEGLMKLTSDPNKLWRMWLKEEEGATKKNGGMA